MSGNQQRKQGRNRSRGPKKVDLWRPVPELAEPEPIVAVDDAGSLLHSLGDPPLYGQSGSAGHYFAAVADRAKDLAVALAAAAGILATADGAGDGGDGEGDSGTSAPEGSSDGA